MRTAARKKTALALPTAEAMGGALETSESKSVVRLKLQEALVSGLLETPRPG